jgi:hypothetical protein
MAASPARVLAMLATGPVRLNGLRAALRALPAGRNWVESGDKDLMVLSLKPKDPPIDPAVPEQQPASSLASHFCVSRRGVVVLFNCDPASCHDVLSLVGTHGAPLAAAKTSGARPTFAEYLYTHESTAPRTLDPPRYWLSELVRQSVFALIPSLAPSASVGLPPSVSPKDELGTKRIRDMISVNIDKTMDEWCSMEGGQISLKRLDADGVHLIASALTQSILLQQFEGEVDKLFAEATWLNERVRVSSVLVAIPGGIRPVCAAFPDGLCVKAAHSQHVCFEQCDFRHDRGVRHPQPPQAGDDCLGGLSI